MLLESLLHKASQETFATKSKWPLDDLSKEIRGSLKGLLHLLQGRVLGEGASEDDKLASNLPTVESEGSQSYIDSSVAVKASASCVHGSQSSMVTEENELNNNDRHLKHQQVSTHQMNRLKRIAFTLFSYKLKINKLRLVVESQPDLELLKSPSWELMIHFEWSVEKQAGFVSTLDASLVNECNYSEAARPFLSVPQSEKALYSMLQAVKCGDNVLLTGNTVRSSYN